MTDPDQPTTADTESQPGSSTEAEALAEPLRDLSGLHKMSAPHDFAAGVTDAIRERSAGRFFGRRAFGDRIPYELLAVIALALGLAVFLLARYSDTGSARPPDDRSDRSEPIDPAVREVIPKP